MKLWHDDIRRPPDETWEWARTNGEALQILRDNRGEIVEASLDHDLGMHDADPDAPHAIYLKGFSEDDGRVLVKAMVEEDLVPALVTIHSWNPKRAKEMADMLNDAGYDCVLSPFKVS